MDKEEILILFSGGADSVLMLELALEIGIIPFCLLIDYGQLHKEELKFAKKFLINRDIKFHQVTIFDYNVVSGLTGTGEKGVYEGVSIYNVPARNTIFLSLAAGMSESRNINKIWIGSDMSDFYEEFPDCKQEYIGKVNNLFSMAFSYPISVEAPLLGFTKEMILKILKIKYGLDEGDFYSGYGEFT